MNCQILDLDGAIASQPWVLRASGAQILVFRDWGPAIRLACSFRRFAQFQLELASRFSQPCFTFCGSGDFHHVTLALVAQVATPFNLLVLDNHPDWVRGVPFLHCGTWLYHAAKLPNVQRIFHVGGDVDFDNHYRWLAPWRLLHSGKIVVLPAIRTYTRGNWSRVPSPCLRQNGSIARAHLESLLRPHLDELASQPLYVSVDKDVLVADDAVVNWDSGHLRLDELGLVLETFLHAAGKRLAGMDTVGDWSPVEVKGPLRRFLHWTEHPNLRIDPADAARRNESVNRRLLEIAGWESWRISSSSANFSADVDAAP